MIKCLELENDNIFNSVDQEKVTLDPASNSKLRKELGLAAKMKVEKDLAPEVELNNWLSVYEGLLGSPNIVKRAELKVV